MLVAGSLITTDSAISQTPAPVTLRWEVTAGRRYVLEFSDTIRVSNDSQTGSLITLRNRGGLEVSGSHCASPSCAVVIVRPLPMVMEYAQGPHPPVSTTMPARSDSVKLRLGTNGAWVIDSADGRPPAAPLLDDFMEAMPLNLPSTPRRPGDSWDNSFTIRYAGNRVLGDAVSHLQGTVRFDSLQAGLAYLTVEAATSLQAKPGMAIGTLSATIIWDVVQHRPVAADSRMRVRVRAHDDPVGKWIESHRTTRVTAEPAASSVP